MKIAFFQKFIDLLRGKQSLGARVITIGENNKINIKNLKNSKLKIFIFGNNNIVNIETINYFDCTIYIGAKDAYCSNSIINVGKETTSNGLTIRVMENESIVNIGKDVMFSENVILFCTDTHSILDENGKVLNVGKSVEIGNHCWVSQDVRFLKNTKILNNSVVGLGSVVTKKFNSENIIIAGNPAKVVKENINWSRQKPQEVLNSY